MRTMNRMMMASIQRNRGMGSSLHTYPKNSTIKKKGEKAMLDNETKQQIKAKVEQYLEKMMDEDIIKADIKIKLSTTDHTDEYKVKVPKPKPNPVLVAMRSKMESMYEENKISQSDMRQIEGMFDRRMFEKAFKSDRDYIDFNSFLVREIYQDDGFTEVDKEELRMDEYALEVLEHLYDNY